ncbi:Proton/glutamate symport protein, Sodium/glutamate symport protein [Mucinivorans hirudinis]|uniref:Proton/glutamate symport protein, Sodium/glutamate symport protein n=1 Tax=Mucinivorans hirudinis TaxID=1433126 RepID=A0A060RAZ7_9BACT|nr:Proton/glutamate symport protein, Sodium/glutamate symport protein [Mucinivorans hirudinis]
MKNLPLYLKILIGMVVGIVLGIAAVNFGFTGVVMDWVKPLGDIFMRLLKFIAIPLVTVSLIKGVANIGTIQTLSSMGLKTVLLFVFTTVTAIVIGLALAHFISPGEMVSAESVSSMQQTYGASISAKADLSQALAHGSPLQPIVDIFPENAFAALANNGVMLQVIFISIIFGISILLVGRERCKPFMDFIESLDAIIMKIVELVMAYSPIGVLALIAGMIVVSAGDVSLLSALGMYGLTVILGLAIMILVVYPLLIKLFTKIPLSDFFKGMMPVQLLAFSTSSSAATLPVTMESAIKRLGVSEKTASFVLPVGVTINMEGTACYQAIAALFIAQVLGIELSWLQMLVIVGTTTLSSIGTPGVPGGSVVILVMVLGSVGIPAEGLALIMGIDRPLDMLRTVVNVTGDTTVAALIDKK